GRFDGLQIDVEGQEKPFGFSIQSIRQNGKNVFEAQKNIAVEIELPRGYPTLKKGMDVYLASSSKVKGAYDYAKPKPKEFQNKINVDVKVEVFEDKIVANSKGVSFEVIGTFEKAKDLNQVYDAFLKSFQKTGETAFELGRFELKNPSELFVPASTVNNLRRGLYEKIKPDLKQGTLSVLPKPIENQKAGWIIKTDNLHLLDELDLELFDEIIYLIGDKPDFEKLSALPFEKIRISLPTVCRKPELLMPVIQKLMDLGFKKWEVANYWGLQIIDAKKYDVSFAPFLYTLNTEAMMMARNINATRISFAMEDTSANIKELADKAFLPTSFIIYQDVPLFTSAVCIRKNDCAHCDGGLKWINLSKDGKYFEALSVPCQTMMFDKLPFCAASIAKDINSSFYQMDFCYKPYTSKQVKETAKKLMAFVDVEPSLKGNLLKTGI
ncbi:MAG TPA: hypothetical protein DIC64_04415, partial [Alphaproteobacteria bacterium]|nr:hypothetical protein [Alphaproteobacteria bacterium]